MVSLSLLKYLENNGFGTIDQNLFWQKMAINDDGIYVSDTGGSQDRGERPSLTYTIYSRAKNDVEAYVQLQQIAEFLKKSFDICELPAVPPITDYGYHNVTIMPPSTIVSVGQDINGRTVYSITGLIYYGSMTDPVPPPLVDGLPMITESSTTLLTEDNLTIITETI